MKKIFFLFLGFIVCGALLTAQTLDEALLGAAVSISKDLPANAMVAVIHVRSDSEKLNDYVTQELHGAILRNRQVMPVKPDQGQMQNIRNELDSSTAGALTGETAQRIGRLLGVQYLITGAIERSGAEYRILFTVLDTNAQLKSQYSAVADPRNDPQLALLLGISPENASSADSDSRKTRQRPATTQAANSRNNWISGELNFVPISYDREWTSLLETHVPLNMGIGARYERMLGSRISLGTNIYWEPSWLNWGGGGYYTFGIDASFHFYPWGKTFFLGAALGFYYYNTYTSFTRTDHSIGAAITPEIGWKIDVGKPGGLYIQPGIAGAFVFGEHRIEYYPNRYKERLFSGLLSISGRVYFGMGYAF